MVFSVVISSLLALLMRNFGSSIADDYFSTRWFVKEAKEKHGIKILHSDLNEKAICLGAAQALFDQKTYCISL